jgi:hypothetical protein
MKLEKKKAICVDAIKQAVNVGEFEVNAMESLVVVLDFDWNDDGPHGHILLVSNSYVSPEMRELVWVVELTCRTLEQRIDMMEKIMSHSLFAGWKI